MEDRPAVYEQRKSMYTSEKVCIGAYVAEYLSRPDIGRYLPIVVDGGSTNLWILHFIHQRELKGEDTVSQVVTSHLEALWKIRKGPENTGVIWTSTGGVLRRSRGVFAWGAEQALCGEAGFVPSVAVIGANGFIPPRLFTNTDAEHPVKKVMIKSTQKMVIFSIDSSKWGVGGKPLHTLDEIVSLGKDVVLVTCYPIFDLSRDSDSTQFNGRLNQFLQTAENLINSWRYSIDISTAVVDFGNLEQPELSVGVQEEGGISDEEMRDFNRFIRGIHGQNIRPEEKQRKGLVIRFNLYRGERT